MAIAIQVVRCRCGRVDSSLPSRPRHGESGGAPTKAGRYSTPIERARRPGSAEPGPSASSDGEDPSRPQQPPETPSGSVDRGIPVSASTNRSPVVVDGKQDVGTKHDGTTWKGPCMTVLRRTCLDGSRNVLDGRPQREPR